MQNLWKVVILTAMVISLSSCTPGTPAQTSQPATTPVQPATATAAPSPTPAATLTSTPMLPSGPLTWSGKTRPLLMAHYMPWYQTPQVSGQWGWHWTMNFFNPSQAADGTWQNLASHFTPLTGPYDSSDEAILEYQVQLMKLSGIDGVIVDWYGNANYNDYGTINANTVKLFQAIKKAGLKFVICYEDQTIKSMVDAGHIQAQDAVASGQEAMRYLQSTWFGDDAYLKVNGQPLLFVFGPQYYKNGDDWKTLFTETDPKPLLITEDNPVAGASASTFPWPPMWAAKDGVLSLDVLQSYLDSAYSKATLWSYRVGGAFPGFYDIYKEANVSPSYGFLDAQDGKTFRFTLQTALDANLDMIQLITWNDYGEGTNIEPTVQLGYQYLETVQEARKITSGGSFSFSADDLRLPYKLYQLREKYTSDAAVTADLDKAAEALLAGDLKSAADIINNHP